MSQSIEHILEQAHTYYSTGDYTNAISFYKKVLKKDKNRIECMFYIGNCYQIINNINSAKNYWEKAAIKGHVESMQYMVNYYFTYEYNIDQIIHWWKQASDLGNIDSTYNLGIFYLDISNNQLHLNNYEQEGLELLKKAAAANHTFALNNLGVYYIYSKDKKECLSGIKYLEKAAALGHNGAMLNLGIYYYKDAQINNNLKKRHSDSMAPSMSLPKEIFAIEWFEKAATAGNVQAMYYLGIDYKRKLDYLKIKPELYDELFENHLQKYNVSWLKKSAEAGNIQGMYELGYYYYDYENNYLLAKIWFEKLITFENDYKENSLSMIELCNLKIIDF